VEAVADVVFAAERLHHLDPDDRLVGGLGQVPLAPLHLARDREHAVREQVREDRDGGIASAAVNASTGFTSASTMPAPTEHHHALDRLDDAPAHEVAHG
jgi:hypothetical protein